MACANGVEVGPIEVVLTSTAALGGLVAGGSIFEDDAAGSSFSAIGAVDSCAVVVVGSPELVASPCGLEALSLANDGTAPGFSSADMADLRKKSQPESRKNREAA